MTLNVQTEPATASVPAASHAAPRDAMVQVRDVAKRYGDVQALKGVTLDVARGTVHGLLGPNGAGKTTLVRVLTTLLTPDSGTATIDGMDVVRDAQALRHTFGLAGQYAAVDANLTGRENLVMIGQLYRLPLRTARARTAELLERFELTDAANRPSKTYSGGMRRRLDLAASLIVNPKVLFLDEPTSGLDPRSRLALWDIIRDLVRDGATLLLTTQYLEEADALADRIAIIDHGQIIAEGTADELKTRLGGDVVDLRVSDPAATAQAVDAIAALGLGKPEANTSTGRITIGTREGSRVLVDVVRALDGTGVGIAEVSLRRPSLDDVFLALTGRETAEERNGAAANGATPTPSRARRRGRTVE